MHHCMYIDHYKVIDTIRDLNVWFSLYIIYFYRLAAEHTPPFDKVFVASVSYYPRSAERTYIILYLLALFYGIYGNNFIFIKMYVSIRAMRHNIKGDVVLLRCLFVLTPIFWITLFVYKIQNVNYHRYCTSFKVQAHNLWMSYSLYRNNEMSCYWCDIKNIFMYCYI